MDRRRIRCGRSRRRTRRHLPHDRPARRALGIFTGPCLSAVQRCHEATPQPGGQRTNVYHQRGDAETGLAGKGSLLAMVINDPEVVAELAALYPRYEAALVSNDAETLTAMFWNSEHALRFGATENLHGFEEISAFRKARPGVNLARTIKRLDIVTFGRDFGSVTLEFTREVDGRSVLGRQSQVWVRLTEGWRIVSAHVSILP